MKPLRMLGFAAVMLCAAFGVASASPWTPVNNVPNIGAGAIALLTDGTGPGARELTTATAGIGGS